MRKGVWNIYVTPEAYLTLAVVLLVLPFNWIVPWFAAAAVHELLHCLTVILTGGKIHGIRVDKHGAQITTSPLSNGQTILCALSGPAGGMLLTLFSHWYPRLAVCGFVQAAFNLLPIRPLDGWQALHGFTMIFLSEAAGDKFCSFLSVCAQVAIFALGVFLSCQLHSVFPLICVLILSFRLVQ